MQRRETISFKVRDVGIGSAYPVTIQSMTNTPTILEEETLQQVRALAHAGAELVRVAVPDHHALKGLAYIVKESPVPIIADIHFDYRLAIGAMEAGVDGLRINPGNLGGVERMQEVVRLAKARKVPMRIGVNSGSVHKKYLAQYGGPTSDAMVASLKEYVQIAEGEGYESIVLSIKASNVPTMIEANRLVAKEDLPYPLHLGVTEAGSPKSGTIKSAVGIGALLSEGIGDTIRVSLTGDPVAELSVARDILRALGLRKEGVEVIACPTCGRTRIDLAPLTAAVEDLVKDIKLPLRIAVMGCAVNGPGEAREAHLGIAGGKGEGLIFKHGETLRKVPENELLLSLKEEIDNILKENENL